MSWMSESCSAMNDQTDCVTVTRHAFAERLAVLPLSNRSLSVCRTGFTAKAFATPVLFARELQKLLKGLEGTRTHPAAAPGYRRS